MGCQHLHVHVTLYSLLLLSFFLYLKSVPIYVIVHVYRVLQCTHFMHYMWTVSTYHHSVWVFTHRLSFMSHTLCSCIQDTPGTTIPPLPHTGDTELTTPQENIADRDEAETTTVSSVYTGLMILIYFHVWACSCGCSRSSS